MDKEQIKEEFKFFVEKCSKSPGSFRNYLSGFSTVEKYIKDLDYEQYKDGYKVVGSSDVYFTMIDMTTGEETDVKKKKYSENICYSVKL